VQRAAALRSCGESCDHAVGGSDGQLGAADVQVEPGRERRRGRWIGRCGSALLGWSDGLDAARLILFRRIADLRARDWVLRRAPNAFLIRGGFAASGVVGSMMTPRWPTTSPRMEADAHHDEDPTKGREGWLE
jgi:hypothetical protein